MAGRTIAIGDIHGCLNALRDLIDQVQPEQSDTVVTLGDYVNRGPDSRGVIEFLAALGDTCNLVPLMGNHEHLLLHNRDSRQQREADVIADPETGLLLYNDQHFEFIESCNLFHETSNHLFVHANYDAEMRLEDQHPRELLWMSFNIAMPKRHFSGKTAIVGHAPQKNGQILDRGHLVCIDTYCYGGGQLTAYDVETGETWQAREPGL